MKTTMRVTFGVALVMGLAACDAGPPRKTALSPEALSGVATEVSPPADVYRVEPEPPPPGETLAAVVRDPDPFSRARRLGALLPTLGPEAIPEVQAIFTNADLVLRGTDLELLVSFWAHHDPEAASRWAMRRAPHGYKIIAILASFSVWAERDPQAARRASEERIALIGDAREAVQIALVRGWYRRDPEGLTQFIHELGMGIGRQRALSTFVREVIREQGPDALVRWAEGLPDDDDVYKKAAYRQVGVALPLFDHAAAIRWCEAHCDGPYGDGLRGLIARPWVLRDGPAALAWLLQAPEGHEKNLAVRTAFSVWGQYDRDAALAWMAEQTAAGPEAWMKPVLPVYARLLADDGSPLEAIEWAEQIESEEEREYVLTDVVRKWRRADEAAAEAWLLESSLSEAARARARGPAQAPARPAPPAAD
jgi:hypothetical protein